MELAALILAAGKGTRMKSALPKVLHPIAGRTMVGHVLDTLAGLNPARVAVVIGPGMEAVAEAVAPAAAVVQPEQLGTADAVKAARDGLPSIDGTVLVLYGDTPFIGRATLEKMVAAREAAAETAVVVLGFRPADPGAYGRLVLGATGDLQAIVEAREASPDELAIDLCNSGVMAIDGARLWDLIDAVGNDNAKGEYYLTDIVAIARGQGLACAYIEADAEELSGVNSRAELAVAEAIMQQRLRAAAMANGATLIDPTTVWFSTDTRIGQDVTIGPNVFFGPGVSVADGAEIRAFSHLEGATLGEDVTIGPFARLRPGAVVAKGARVGNFVEVKNATLEEGAKVNHLSYIGDARVGKAANVGAGTITCNYDGFLKHHTDIGDGAFIGSNTALVGPVKIGDGAIVGAGSTITKDVAAGALAVERADTKTTLGWAKMFREKKSAEKAAQQKSKQKNKQNTARK
ncbi:MAG TPA: bifunctional UDP-N-acetylglucosamine diphosphorylase/glucosamine-1-phosphate N-acetyltransferase GlmU [Alphaproteobacteria bacterium]|nr:bifunctional UDP-N-acetylglucosamine diphosphorylase/glucosamine-1-phosphate N-acetyltransferase GlmU [Alphaproteobacteria bacterium]